MDFDEEDVSGSALSSGRFGERMHSYYCCGQQMSCRLLCPPSSRQSSLFALRMQVLERHEDDMTCGQVTSRAGRQAQDNNIESPQ